MPEAYCCGCDKPTSPNIESGWGICRRCREKPVYDFTALYANVPSRKGRDYIVRAVKKYLPKGATA